MRRKSEPIIEPSFWTSQTPDPWRKITEEIIPMPVQKIWLANPTTFLTPCNSKMKKMN
jgi:hypothetical protein